MTTLVKMITLVRNGQLGKCSSVKLTMGFEMTSNGSKDETSKNG